VQLLLDRRPPVRCCPHPQPVDLRHRMGSKHSKVLFAAGCDTLLWLAVKTRGITAAAVATPSPQAVGVTEWWCGLQTAVCIGRDHPKPSCLPGYDLPRLGLWSAVTHSTWLIKSESAARCPRR
jgi:hypothetical protein